MEKIMTRSAETHFRSIARHVHRHASAIVAHTRGMESTNWQGRELDVALEKIAEIRYRLKEIEQVLVDMLPELEKQVK